MMKVVSLMYVDSFTVFREALKCMAHRSSDTLIIETEYAPRFMESN